MQEEINEILKKHLPEQVGDVLRERLEQADQDSNSLKTARNSLVQKEEQIEKLKATVQEYQSLNDRNSGLDAREKDISVREVNLAIRELSYQLESEKQKTQFAKDVALGLVRNTTYRESAWSSKNENIMNPQGYRETVNNTDSTTKTTDAD